MNIISLNELTATSQGFEVFEEAAGPTSSWKNLKIRGVFQRADAKNQNGRIYPMAVLENALADVAETLRSRNMFAELDHPCLLSSDFRVLTVDGWKNFLDITPDDKVYSRVNGKAIISDVVKVINAPYKGIAYTVKGRSIDSAFTANHDFLLEYRKDSKKHGEEFKVSIDTIASDRVKYTHTPIPKTASFERPVTTTFTIPGIPDAPYRPNRHADPTKDLVLDAKTFAAFMGIYLAEGGLGNGNSVCIHQKNEWSRDYIKTEILDMLSPELVWNIQDTGFQASDARLSQFLAKCGSLYNKRIPAEVKALDVECLRELVFWFGIGDGRFVHAYKKNTEFGDASTKQMLAEDLRKDLGKTNHKFQLFTVSKQLISDLHECVTLFGGSGSLSEVVTKKDYTLAGRTIKAENKVPLHVLTVSTTKHIWLDHRVRINKLHHEGNIYCLTTTHGNFYMEQNGKAFWTGNCNGDPLVSLKNVSHVITNLKFSGKDMIGEAVVFDDPGPAGTPSGRILGALIRNGCTVGISSRGMGALGHDRDGQAIVEQYKLVTFDCVHNPSTHNAYVFQVNESANLESVIKTEMARKERAERVLGIRNTLRVILDKSK